MTNYSGMRSIPSTLPDIVQGAPLNGEWEVIVPIARRNEVLNPSLETNLTGYTAGAGALTRDATKQYHGTYAAKYVPSAALTDGFFYGTISTTALQIRALSCKWWGQPNVKYALTIATTGGTDLAVFPFLGTGRWMWTVLYYQETTSTTRRLYFRKNGSNDVHPFWVDGVQSEVINAGEYVSTYIDGDQQGFLTAQSPAAYGWNGTPHASSSFRSLQTRAGGYVIPFKKYSFVLLAMLGLGLAQVQNVNTDYAQVDGGNPNFTHKPISQFSVVGNVPGGTYGRLRSNRSQLGQLFDRDMSALDQPLLLRYRHLDACDSIDSDTIVIPCKYVTGWEGQTNNPHAQAITMTFETYLPALVGERDGGGALSVQTSITNANSIMQRSPAGLWNSMGTGTSPASVFMSNGLVGSDGTYYAGGSFNSMGGIANTAQIARWNPNTSLWSAMGTGGPGGGLQVLAITQAPNGDIIAAGNFNAMGGVANTAFLAKWNFVSQVWQSITATPIAGTSVNALVYDLSGNLYIAGSFTAVNGVAAASIAKMDTAGTWTALSTGINNVGRALVVDRLNNLYVGGAFTTPFPAIAKWNGTAFSGLGTGLDAGVSALAFDNANLLYAGGQFATSGGTIALLRIATWNGVQWAPLGSGIVTGSLVNSLVYRSGLLHIGGTFSNAGGVPVPDGYAIWNGSAYTYPDIDPAGTLTFTSFAFAPDGTLYMGFNSGSSAGTAIAGSVTVLNNEGTARTYPTLTLNGPTSGSARIYSLVNTTTGAAIYFNYTILAGEVATLVFQPDNLSFTSSVVPGGNIANVILPGSSEAAFFLQKGNNTFTLFSASTTVTASMSWPVSYLSMDDVQ